MPNTDAIMAVLPIAFILGGYVVVMVVCAIAIGPARMKLVEIGEEMLAEAKWNDAERAKINWLLDTCMSFRVSVLLPVAALGVILDNIIGRNEVTANRYDRLVRDQRYHMMMYRYLASILAVNPLVAVASFAVFTLMLAVRGPKNGDTRAVVEEPVRRLTTAPC